MQKLPNFSYEKKLWKRGFKIIAGLDEVGRGCLAGPVVTGCVVFKSFSINIPVKIDDSKKLTTEQREKASIWIKENAICFGIGSASVAEINKHGIVEATNKAFRRAINNVKRSNIQYLLIDAFYIPYTKDLPKGKQSPIVKGDSKSISIAAASIIAKVYRDELMIKLSRNKKYKQYLWNKNKGYGTLEHQDAIKKHGLTKHHRKLFVRKFI